MPTNPTALMREEDVQCVQNWLRDTSEPIWHPLCERILATYRALAASQQEVAEMHRWFKDRGLTCAESVVDGLQTALAAAREDCARWQFARSRGVILFDQGQPRDTFLFDRVADAALDTARSTDAERTHGGEND